MKRLFSTHGIPEKLLTDNGRQFVSREFELFAKEWNFAHITSSPYYAQSNGLLKMLSSKQNSCWRNAEKMDLMFSCVS